VPNWIKNFLPHLFISFIVKIAAITETAYKTKLTELIKILFYDGDPIAYSNVFFP
jgi:hypothetical protein